MKRKELREKLGRCKAYAHAAKRAKQRYGITLKYKQYKILCNRIKNQKDATFLWKTGPGRTLWRLEYCAATRPLVAIWDEDALVILTFLPIEAIKLNDRRIDA